MSWTFSPPVLPFTNQSNQKQSSGPTYLQYKTSTTSLDSEMKKANVDKNSDLVKTILRTNPALERRHNRESSLTSKIFDKNLNFLEKRQKTFLVSFNDRRTKTANHYERLRDVLEPKNKIPCI